jgi:hypothetical protein
VAVASLFLVASMMEASVNALMSVADEEAWEKASLFDPPTTHLNTVHLSIRSYWPWIRRYLQLLHHIVVKVYHLLQNSVSGCSARAPTVCNSDSGDRLHPDGGIMPPCGVASLVVPKSTP